MADSKQADANDVTRVSLRFCARLSYRPVAIDLISALVEHVEGADDDFRNELVTAFGEAFNNIVIHGYRGRTDGMLDIDAEMGPNVVTLHLSDTGRSVDFSEVPTPDLTSMPEGGMGVFMMHALVDEVVYRGGSPNVLSLVKRTSVSGETR